MSQETRLPVRRIGLISDTHGLLRPEAVCALCGSDLIIHAGDVGKPEILDSLRELAPVVAVRGNIDNGKWAERLPATEIVELDGTTLYVLHDLQRLELDPVAAGVQIVVSGHTHQTQQTTRAGVLFVNPGSAGPRRFNLPITLAKLNLGQIPWRVDFVNLAEHT